MTRTKKIIAGLCTAALAACAALGLAGCGEDVAATWAHGKVLESDVTAAAEGELKYYVNDDGTYDISSWTNYIANREYDEYATEEEQEANEKAADGTVADYREYLAKQQLREDIVAYEVEKRGIEVTEEEIDEQLEFEAQIYESYYGGGHAGTFESILNNYFGMTLDQYKEGVAKQLKEDKLKEQVVAERSGADSDDAAAEGEASSDETASGDEAASSDEAAAEDEEADEDAIFNAYIDELMESYSASVTACPENLSYDPQTLAASQEADSAEDDGSAEDTASEDGEDAAKE
ncbi:MAG: hypothetical protein ACI36W_05085 [Coriobacteriales bacterium]